MSATLGYRVSLNWATIIASTTVGTTLEDLAHRSPGIGYAGGARIDKLSLPITVVLPWLTRGEPISPRFGVGIDLMVTGAILTVGG